MFSAALTSIVLASVSGVSWGQIPPFELEIRESAPPYIGQTASGPLPFHYGPSVLSNGGQSGAAGDFNDDGLVDLWVGFGAVAWPDTYHDLAYFDARRFRTGPPNRISTHQPWPAAWGSGSTVLRQVIPLAAGTKTVVAAIGTPYPTGPVLPRDYRILIANARVSGVVDVIPNPTTAPPGLLPPRALWEIHPLGDLEGDGYDEFAIAGLSLAPDEDPLWLVVDGASRTVRWSDYYHPPGGSSSTSGALGAHRTRAQRFTDVDGDGVLDPVLGYTTGGQSENWLLRCLSGVDGSLIWEYSDYMGAAPSFQFTHEIGDLDGDGHGDIVLRMSPVWGPGISHPDDLNGYFRVVSGRTGTLIWSIPLGPLDPGFVSGQTVVTVYGPTSSTVIDLPDVDGDGARDVMLRGQVTTPPYPDRYFLLSGADGALLQTIDREQFEVHPWWQSAPGQTVETQVSKPVGDMDGDGWPEWLGNAIDSNPQVPSGGGLAVFSIASLRGPAQAQEGDLIDLEFWLPGAPNRPVRLLASDKFSPYDGHSVGSGRNTHLGSSTLLNATLGSAALIAHLDAAGKATMPLTIPAGAGLAGKRVYFTGVVGDSGFRDGIRCLTSTLSIEILP